VGEPQKIARPKNHAKRSPMAPHPDITAVLDGRSRWCVVTGDCLQVLPSLPDKGVAHVITDPPYSRGLYLRYRTNGGAVYTPSAKANRTDQAIELANLRIGAIDDILEDTAAHILRLTTRWSVAFHDMEIGHRWRAAFGDRYIRTGIWVKPNGMPQISGDRPGMGYEPFTIGHASGRKRWNGGGRSAIWTHNGENSQTSERDELGHPCPKPLSLMIELVELFTDPDDVVLDCFAGSGTTGVACLRLGRRFIGIERDKTFARTARDRLTAEGEGSTLRQYRAGQLPLFAGAK
jgi:site-specific DNA-methyltransferase (adenine-specific)